MDPAAEPLLSEETLRAARSAAFWRALCPGAAVTGAPFRGLAAPYPVPPAVAAQAIAQMVEEGYLHTPPLIPRAEAHALAACVLRVVQRGFPAPFALVYDALWQTAARVAGVIAPVLEPRYRLVPDFWAWVVGPGHEPAGWRAHRDLEQRHTLRPDGFPEVITVWLPLTDATPLNSCMYVLPFDRDPNIPDDLKALVVPPGCEAHVRCLAAPAGSVLAWNPYVLHWGSEASRWAREPRISFALYCERSDVPPFAPNPITVGAPLSLQRRLAMIARMVLKYDYRYAFARPLLDFCRRCVSSRPA